MQPTHTRLATLLACIPLFSSLSARSQIQSQKPVILAPRPNPESKPLGDLKIESIPMPKVAKTKVGDRYRLWFSFNPTDVNDPMYPGKPNPYDDHGFDCYGKLFINGVVRWEMPKGEGEPASQELGHLNLPEPLKVNARFQGYKMNTGKWSRGGDWVYESVDGSTSQSTVNVALKLYDRDNPTFFDEAPYPNGVDRTDDLFGDFNIKLDLSKMSEGHYYWFWNGKDGSGNAVGSNFYLYIEHVSSIYESRKSTLPVPHIPPQLPAGGPIFKGGPIIKRVPFLKTR